MTISARCEWLWFIYRFTKIIYPKTHGDLAGPRFSVHHM
jgi:hypothetical protein